MGNSGTDKASLGELLFGATVFTIANANRQFQLQILLGKKPVSSPKLKPRLRLTRSNCQSKIHEAMAKDYSFAGFYEAHQLSFSTEAAKCVTCGKLAIYFNFQDAFCEDCIARVFGPPRDPKEQHQAHHAQDDLHTNLRKQRQPKSRLRNAFEWLLYVKNWGGWQRAILVYALFAMLLWAFWMAGIITASDDSYERPWMTFGLAAIAAPTSLLFLLALSRMLQQLKEPLILLGRLAWKAALILFGIWVVIHVLPSVFSESPWAYAARYGADSSHVQVAAKPADCDFLHAPIGFKGCHYEKLVQVTRYRSDKNTHQSMVSYDDGKTWSFLSTRQKSGSIEVYVLWERASDVH
jgi:hypothetical protein